MFPAFLSLRHKVILGVAAVYLFMASVIIGSYYFMKSLEVKISYLEEVSKLEEAALEIRRFEKNYFLYGDDQSLKTALYHLARINSLVDKNLVKIEELISPRETEQFRDSLAAYENLLTGCFDLAGKGQCVDSPETKADYESNLRKAGGSILTIAEKLAARKRQSIRETMSVTLKLLLLGLTVAGFGFVAIGGFLSRQSQQVSKIARDRRRGRS